MEDNPYKTPETWESQNKLNKDKPKTGGLKRY